VATKVKQKTRKSLVSRFKVSGTGKLMHNRPGRRHILTSKSAKRKRHLRKESVLAPALERTYSRLMGVA
jgi:large subunit ribosomal protein L35